MRYVEKIPVNMNNAKISKLKRCQPSMLGHKIAKKERYVHMLDECARASDIFETSETDLGDNSTKLATGGRDTMRGGTVTSREGFSGNNESCRVGTKVLEEVGEAVKEYESLRCGRGRSQLVIGES